MFKICGKELENRRGGGKEKTPVEQAKEQMSAEQLKRVEAIERLNRQHKKNMSNIGELFKYDETEWQVGESDKADRDQMVAEVFAALKDPEMSPLYKSGMTIKLLMQYTHKWQ